MNLSSRQNNIINYLKTKDEWATGKELSKIFNVSLRTIRNDINAINSFQSSLILSDRNKGYRLKSKLDIISSQQNFDLNIDQRKHFLFIYLIIHTNTKFSIFELADSLFISEYTLLHDLEKIRQEIVKLSQYEIYLEKKNNEIIIYDPFHNSPLLLNQYVSENDCLSDSILFKKCFDFLDVRDIKAGIQEYIPPSFFNRYLTYNTVLIITCCLIEQFIYGNANYDSSTYKQIDPQLESYLNKIIDLYSLDEYKRQFKSYFVKCLYPLIKIDKIENEIKQSTSIFDKDYAILYKILKTVKTDYCIDLLTEKELILKFLIHLKIAFARTNLNIHINNPLLEHFRKNYTFLFDVAFFIADSFAKEKSITLTKNEISYLVIYLIGPLKGMKEKLYSNFNISILFFILEGPALFTSLSEIIFSSKEYKNIEITPIYSTQKLQSINEEAFDIIISTSNNVSFQNTNCVYITPSMTFQSISQIQKKFINILNIKQLNYFDRMFEYFFNESQFLYNLNFNNEVEYINYGVKQLKKYNFVEDSFFDEVLEREQLLSTSFESGVALPHATKNNAIKSCIQFARFKKPILWNNTKVKCAFLIATSNEDIQLLNVIYKVIIDICSSNDYVNKLSKCSSINDLKSLLFSVYKSI